MELDVWKTLFHENFDNTKYLYHYTSFDKALKIINSNRLLFSSITNTNDTTESKLKILFEQPNTMNEAEFNDSTLKLMAYFSGFVPNIKLMCFSMDSTIDYKENKIEDHNIKELYYDYSGRGFALPRMWAQYADNNTGVCFIFNKSRILDKLSSITRHYELPVKYKPFTQRFKIDGGTVKSLLEQIKCDNNGNLIFYDYLFNYKGKKLPPYIEYNYFRKLNDWKHEQEYRILALVDDNEKALYLDEIATALEGIVLAEKIDVASENALRCFAQLRKIVKSKTSIKKIKFDINRISIE